MREARRLLPDIVIMDIVMAGLSGSDAAAQIRDQRAHQGHNLDQFMKIVALIDDFWVNVVTLPGK